MALKGVGGCRAAIRDVTFNEDWLQIRTGQGPRTKATLRNLAISLLYPSKLILNYDFDEDLLSIEVIMYCFQHICYNVRRVKI